MKITDNASMKTVGVLTSAIAAHRLTVSFRNWKIGIRQDPTAARVGLQARSSLALTLAFSNAARMPLSQNSEIYDRSAGADPEGEKRAENFR